MTVWCQSQAWSEGGDWEGESYCIECLALISFALYADRVTADRSVTRHQSLTSLAHTWQMTLICINKSHGSPVTKHMSSVCYDYTGYWLLATSFWRNEIYFEGYSWVPVAMYIIWYWMMAGAWYFLCYSAPNILLLSRLASPAGAGVQFDDCLDLFLFCLHALILNSLALHAVWSKLWACSEKGKVWE